MPEEAFIDQASENFSTLVGVQLEETSCLLDGGRKAAHLHELASHAIGDLITRLQSTTVAEGRNREGPRRYVEGRGGAPIRLRSALRHSDILREGITISTIRPTPSRVKSDRTISWGNQTRGDD
jgi:hypothetical protein